LNVDGAAIAIDCAASGAGAVVVYLEVTRSDVQCRAGVDKNRAATGRVVVVEIAAFDCDGAAVHENRASPVVRGAFNEVRIYRSRATVSVIENATHSWFAVAPVLVGKIALQGSASGKDIQCAAVIIERTKELGAVNNDFLFLRG